MATAAINPAAPAVTYTLTLHPEHTCSQCGDPCGHVFEHDGQALCLGCELDTLSEWEQQREQEAAGWEEAEDDYFTEAGNPCLTAGERNQ